MRLPESFRDLLEVSERQLRDLVDGAGDASRWDAMLVAVEALAPMLAAKVDASAEERPLIGRLRESLERDLREVATSAMTDVDTLVSFARGELELPAGDPLNWMDEESGDLPPGAQLLPDLQRLAAD